MQVLKAHDLPLEETDWDQLIAIGTRRSFAKRDLICSEEEPARDYFVVVAGCVEIYKEVKGAETPGGMAAEIRLALLEAGASFGERCLFDDTHRTACARAYQDTDVLVIDGAALASLLDRDEALAARFYKALCVKLSNIVQDVESDLRHLHRRLTFY
jgi:CRP-like cAMP-binding protein